MKKGDHQAAPKKDPCTGLISRILIHLYRIENVLRIGYWKVFILCAKVGNIRKTPIRRVLGMNIIHKIIDAEKS